MISVSQHRKYLKTAKNLDTLKGTTNRKRRILKQLHEQQDGKCMWCGNDTQLWWERSVEEFALDNPLRQATFEHVKLRSNGGLFTADNGGCACAECNGIRKNISFNSFKYITADSQRYSKWMSRMEAKMSTKARAKKQRQFRAKQEYNGKIFSLACAFENLRRYHSVDYYAEFMYARSQIKLIGEQYGLFR